MPGQRTVINSHATPLPQFEDNEVYGATESALSYWWIGTEGAGNTVSSGYSVFKNFRVWHVHNKGIFHYEGARIVHDGFTVRGQNPGPTAACCGMGFDGADYKSDDVTIKNADIQGMQSGIAPSARGNMVVEASRLRNLNDLYSRPCGTRARPPASSREASRCGISRSRERRTYA